MLNFWDILRLKDVNFICRGRKLRFKLVKWFFLGFYSKDWELDENMQCLQDLLGIRWFEEGVWDVIVVCDSFNFFF